MLEINDRVPGFIEFNLLNAYGDPVSFLVTEAGIIIPQKDWKETWTDGLHKFVDRADEEGELTKISVEAPATVEIDRSNHAVNQIYRWEHRNNQVTWDEIVADIKKAAPLVVKIINDGMVMGARGNQRGRIWIHNQDNNLNLIVQVKGQEQPGHLFKIVVVTILRAPDVKFYKQAPFMAKINIDGGVARITYSPEKISGH